jgi:hypothetical protein
MTLEWFRTPRLKRAVPNQAKGRENTRPFVAYVMSSISGQTIVTEKSRLLSAMAPMKLASFCIFHSFYFAAQP